MLRKRLHILRFNANAMFRHQRNKCQVLLTSARRKHQRFIPGTGPQLDREGPEASQSQLPFQKSDPVHSSHSIKGWPLRRSLMTLWCSSCMLTWPRHPWPRSHVYPPYPPHHHIHHHKAVAWALTINHRLQSQFAPRMSTTTHLWQSHSPANSGKGIQHRHLPHFIFQLTPTKPFTTTYLPQSHSAPQKAGLCVLVYLCTVDGCHACWGAVTCTVGVLVSAFVRACIRACLLVNSYNASSKFACAWTCLKVCKFGKKGRRGQALAFPCEAIGAFAHLHTI